MSFTCEECGYKNNEIKTGGAIAPKGRRLCLKVKTTEDMNRDLLKVRFIALSFPSFPFPSPPLNFYKAA